MDFHPLSEQYPLMPAYELGRMEEAMRERGYDPRFPVWMFQGKILDGRNRSIAAERAGLTPIYALFQGTFDEAKQFVITANEERRHLAPEWLKRRREERIGRVAEARREGESLRSIAKEEKISVVQVQRDLESASGVPGGTPDDETAKTTGKDGKSYPAKNQDARTAPEQPAQEPEDWQRVRSFIAEHPDASNKEIHRALGVSEHVVAKVKLKMQGENVTRPIPTRPPRNPRPPKNGREKFDWKAFDASFGKVVRATDELAGAYEGEKKSREFLECHQLLSKFLAIWQSWQKRLTKV